MGKQEISITVDAVIFYQKNNEKQVLLIQRKKDPFKGAWALPGGFLEKEESLEDGAKRELEEETGLKIGELKQIRAFGTPGRDPRGRIISIAFFAETREEQKVKGSDDASDAKWFNIKELPDLAFDHNQIIKEALEQLK